MMALLQVLRSSPRPGRPSACGGVRAIVNLVLFCLLFVSATGAVTQAASGTGGFELGNRLTAEGRYAEGAAAYDGVAAAGPTSAALEFNRAQARAKVGDLPRAWAHLRLAGRLDPRDAAIRRATHQLASRIPAGSVPEPAWFSWLHRLTLNEWAGLAALGMWLWGGLLLAGLWRPVWRERNRLLTAGAAGLALSTSILLAAALWSRWRAPDVVVIRPDAQVRVSPLEEARTAFLLPAGSELRHRDLRGDWVMVEEVGSGRFGWMQRSDLVVLPLL